MNKKHFVLTFVALLLLGGSYVARPHLKMLPMVANYYAKEFCTCIYVIKNTEEFCREFIAFEQVSAEIDFDENQVHTSVFGFWKGYAEYQNKRLGCSLKTEFL